MADWISVIALILVGLAFVIAEIILVPGTTVVGILGLIAMGYGIFLGFEYFGSEVGWWIVAGSTVSFAIALYFSFKEGAWTRFSLKETMPGKVNEGLVSRLKVGDEGVTLSSLRPFGKADFESGEYEVRSMGNYMDSGTKVKIVRIDINNIFVEPIN